MITNFCTIMAFLEDGWAGDEVWMLAQTGVWHNTKLLAACASKIQATSIHCQKLLASWAGARWRKGEQRIMEPGPKYLPRLLLTYFHNAFWSCNFNVYAKKCILSSFIIKIRLQLSSWKAHVKYTVKSNYKYYFYQKTNSIFCGIIVFW